MIRLVRPSTIYKASYLKAVVELQKEGRDKEIDRHELARDFSAYVNKINGWAKGKGLQKGYVPMTTYWLVDGKKYIGKVKIRHRLNPHLRRIGGHIGYEIRPSARRQRYGTMILKLALLKARKLGIKKALLTCDITNVGSRKIIEANGGVFEKAVKVLPNEPKKMRFWIKN